MLGSSPTGDIGNWSFIGTMRINDDLEKVARLELIDEDGRVFTYYDVFVNIDIQDNGRTMKVFVTVKSLQL